MLLAEQSTQAEQSMLLAEPSKRVEEPRKIAEWNFALMDCMSMLVVEP